MSDTDKTRRHTFKTNLPDEVLPDGALSDESAVPHLSSFQQFDGTDHEPGPMAPMIFWVNDSDDCLCQYFNLAEAIETSEKAIKDRVPESLKEALTHALESRTVQGHGGILVSESDAGCLAFTQALARVYYPKALIRTDRFDPDDFYSRR